MMEDVQETKWYRLRRFAVECKRILKVTRKPDALEFKTIVKVSGLGIIIIGFIGFLIQMARQLLIR